MTSSETADAQKMIVSVLRHRAGSGGDAPAVAAAARRAYDELAFALAPLIGNAGVDALLARALHLTQREYPSDPVGREQSAELLDRVSLWLERQDSAIATDAAAAMFAAFAALLATLIGEPLTKRYLRKAWPESFFDTMPEGTSA
ncbi:MAG TPA: hypothetical protein VGK04_04760 [Thermoanaerobaculia bacterium]|jgi:hypothetical protein